MIQIRQGIFETNSSSIHSLSVMMESDYRLWRNGELLQNNCTDDLPELCTKQQALEWCQAQYPYEFDPENKYYWQNHYGSEDSYLMEQSFHSYDYFSDSANISMVHFTTPGGEEVVAISSECYG